MARGGVPTKPPNFSTRTLARERPAPEVVYEFSNGRNFIDSRGAGGFYSVNLNGIDQETLDPSLLTFPDLLLEDGSRLLQE